MQDCEIIKRIGETKKQLNELLMQADGYPQIYEICNLAADRIIFESDGTLFLMQHCSQIWKGESAYLRETVYDKARKWNHGKIAVEDVARFYTEVKFALFRIEHGLHLKQEDDSEQLLMELNISPDMIYFICVNEVEDIKGVMYVVGQNYIARQMNLPALRLFSFLKEISVTDEVRIALAQVYLNLGKADRSYAELKQIEEPDDQTRELLDLLEQKLSCGVRNEE